MRIDIQELSKAVVKTMKRIASSAQQKDGELSNPGKMSVAIDREVEKCFDDYAKAVEKKNPQKTIKENE